MKLYQKIAHLLRAIENCEKSGNDEWLNNHRATLQTIEWRDLPHGSGFDAGCKILETNGDKIIMQADFHAMDENGYYCGWKEYQVVVKPSLLFDFDLTIRGRDYNGLKDYIADTFRHVLSQEYKEVTK